MKQFLQRTLLGLAMVVMAGCSGMGLPSTGSVFGDGGGSSIHVTENKSATPNGALLKYAASIHINSYMDARKIDSPRKIGTGAENVFGMGGKDIVLDLDVATMVTGAIKTRLDDAGFQVNERKGGALFELSGVVRDLSYDVKARDEVTIAIETTLKEAATGKVLWSGIVTEKNDRFAGVSGNNKNDVAIYLGKELGIVTGKITEAVSASLMVMYPELFNPMPGTRATPGVAVLIAPTVANTPPPAIPVQQAVPIPAVHAVAPVQTSTPQATSTSGLLLVNTNPVRAKVYLDGVYYGLSPLRLEMEPGVHALNIKMEGYKTVAEKVSVRKGDSTEMDLDLER